MKKITILFYLFLGLFNVSAQDEGFQTIFHGPVRISGMGGPFMIFSEANGQFVHLMGGGGGVIINDFVFGGFGYGSTNHLNPPDLPDFRDLNLRFGFGGLMAGYTFLAQRAVHPAIYLNAGWGEAGLYEKQDVAFLKDNIFIVMPQLEIELNFTRFFKLGVGATYRIATGVDIPGLLNGDLSGPGASLSFRFGAF
jgi:hypothetical protein